jgi:hypothetical protein
MQQVEEPKPKDYNTFGSPRIKVHWQSGGEGIHIGRHCKEDRETIRVLNMGIQGSGKSSLLEVFAVRFQKIIDLFGSVDGESLCWCKPEFIEFFKLHYGREPKILLVTGDGKKVASNFDSMHIDELTLKDIEEHDITTTTQMFHTKLQAYYATIGKVIDILEKRIFWDDPWALCIREAGDWGRARTKVVADDEGAKQDLIRFYRQNRHHGLAVFMDTLRWTNIDKEIRDLSNYICIKKIGIQLLPKDLRFLYRYWKPRSLMRLPNKLFGLITDNRSIGIGTFEYPTWHKATKENILKSTGIEIEDVETGERTDERRYGVGDLDHATIIEKYIELQSIGKVAKELVRSKSTISNHIAEHNLSIKRQGECKKCHNAKGQFSKDTIIKKTEKP